METHHTIKSFSEKHPAYTPGAVRCLIFKRGKKLEEQGAIYRRGARVVIVEERFLEVMKRDDAAVSA
ncbi:MAG TPA: hypothetical protein VHP37_06885 [Burkholderiales bacterium]|nr:hypothetical protein [Burkholderiales bacterium]